MAQAQLIQGSWDEIAAHAEEFKNRSDLMLIIPGDTEPKSGIVKAGMNLAEALKGRTGLVNFEPTDLSEDTAHGSLIF
jgi:hypothetical protein